METKTRGERQVEDVVGWRRDRLAEAGFSPPLAILAPFERAPEAA